VDFKTSEVTGQEDANKRARESLRDSQLGLYALAYRETRGVTPAAVELQFVESGLAGRARVEEKHLTAAAERIDEAAAGIRAASLAARPEYNACRYCPYNNFCPYTATRSGV
jgi:RecB family exonuclease